MAFCPITYCVLSRPLCTYDQAKPKIFYILPKRQEALTLEKDLKGMYREEEESTDTTSATKLAMEDKSKAAKAVSKWIRQCSGVFKVRLLKRLGMNIAIELFSILSNISNIYS